MATKLISSICILSVTLSDNINANVILQPESNINNDYNPLNEGILEPEPDNGPCLNGRCKGAYDCYNYDACDYYHIEGGYIDCAGASSCNYECFYYGPGSYAPCSGEPQIISTSIQKGDITCSGVISCESTDIIESAKNLICSGFQSCYGSSSTQTKDNDKSATARLNINCDGSESCSAYSSANYLSTFNAGKKQYCNGYSSCSGNENNKEVLKPGNTAYCYGADGCAKTKIEAGVKALCMGAASCCRTDITTSKATLCAGYRSCQQAKINAQGGRVDAYGYQSAAESTITDASVVRAEAYQALLNAVIDSNGGGGGVYIFRECQAGQGARVICRNGDTCKVKCVGKGCKGLTYQCEPGAICRLEPRDCKKNSGASYRGTACPTLTSGTAALHITAVAALHITAVATLPIPEYYPSMEIIETELDAERKRQAKIPESCTRSDCKACERANQCKKDRIREDAATKCMGARSCARATIVQTGTVPTHPYPYLWCSGDQACIGADITTKTRVYCGGSESCEEAEISANEYISCDGESSCQESIIELKSGSTAVDPDYTGLRCNGKDSCSRAQISRSSGSNGPLRCAGVNACNIAQISYSTDISCTGYNSCRSSTISTSNGNLDCMGEYTCASSNINVVQKNANTDATVTIYGRLGGYFSTISADVVKAYGNHAIYAATVDSEGRGSMIVEAFSPMSASYSRIICRSGSQCVLKCKGSACFYANYICLPGARCSTRPKQCRAKSGGSYKGTDCPTFQSSITENTLDAHLKELDKMMFVDEEFKKLELMVDDFDHEYVENEIVDENVDEEELDLDQGIF